MAIVDFGWRFNACLNQPHRLRVNQSQDACPAPILHPLSTNLLHILYFVVTSIILSLHKMGFLLNSKQIRTVVVIYRISLV
jgi:hypothetical protein